jgi:lauroyl/myristoyl acyltransferase
MSASCVLQVLGLFLCHGLRWIELFLSPGFLQVLCWPIAALAAFWELTYAQPTVRQFHRLPPSLRPALTRSSWVRRVCQQRIQVSLAKFLSLWPDRFGNPRWRRRCQCTGIEHLEETCAQGRPIVLAVLHFGPLIVLRYWLRARGLPVAGLIARTSNRRPLHRRYLDRLSDAAGGLAGVPHIFDLTQLRKVYRFLRSEPGDRPSRIQGTGPVLASPRLLLITVEGNDGEHVLVKRADFCFRMATGALRLAARADAHVLPCLIRAERPIGFTIHFGKPVPREWIRDKCRHAAACEHLLEEFLPLLCAHPEQSGFQLLCCFQPLLSNGIG